jgi:Ca2+-binding EF-hand superfamily protein
MFKSAEYVAVGLTLVVAAAVQAENIVDAHIKAVGGAAAIAKIKTIHRTATLSGTSGSFPLSGVVEEIYDLSKDRGYTSMELLGYSRKTGWNGDSGWVNDKQAGVTDMPAAEVALAKFNVGPSPLAAIYARQGAEVLKEGGDKEFNGKRCTLVAVEGLPIEFYVNQQTKLLDGMSIPGILEVTLENHKAINGVQFAGRATMKLDAQNMTMIYEYKATRVNEEIDAARFKKPSNRSVPAPGLFTAKQLISSMDTNGDGKISKDEAPQELKTNFEYIDKNNDGAIDAKEAEVMVSYANNPQAGFTKPAPTDSRPVTAKQLISSMDKNGDGRINKNEAPEDLKLFFGDIDGDGDGTIDVKEAQAMAKYANEQAGVTQPAAATGGVTAQQAIAQLDVNGDGKISVDEASQELKPHFSQFDTDSDGAIDEKEVKALLPYINAEEDKSKEPASATGKLTAKQIISYMDKNGDGKISKDEASDELKPNFGYIDTNGDGAIDLKDAKVIAEYANKESRK